MEFFFLYSYYTWRLLWGQPSFLLLSGREKIPIQILAPDTSHIARHIEVSTAFVVTRGASYTDNKTNTVTSLLICLALNFESLGTFLGGRMLLTNPFYRGFTNPSPQLVLQSSKVINRLPKGVAHASDLLKTVWKFVEHFLDNCWTCCLELSPRVSNGSLMELELGWNWNGIGMDWNGSDMEL